MASILHSFIKYKIVIQSSKQIFLRLFCIILKMIIESLYCLIAFEKLTKKNILKVKFIHIGPKFNCQVQTFLLFKNCHSSLKKMFFFSFPSHPFVNFNQILTKSTQKLKSNHVGVVLNSSSQYLLYVYIYIYPYEVRIELQFEERISRFKQP